MTMQVWFPGAERIPGKHSSGLPMGGGNVIVTHHITVDPTDYPTGKRVLLQEGYEPTLLLDPVQGHRGQFLPADRGAYALEHPAGTPPTNTEGKIHVQIEWLWHSMTADITKAAHFGDIWADLIPWLRQLGCPDVWTFGFKSTSRDARVWKRSGHRGHLNAPNNHHVDNLPAAREPAWPGATHPLTKANRQRADELTPFMAARHWPLTDADRKRLTKLRDACDHALNVK